MIAQYPKFNWVICHSPYAFEFEGDENTDWGHTHHELKISFGRTIGSVSESESSINFVLIFSHGRCLLNRYVLFWARSGTFYRYGDGGFMNVCTPIFQICNSKMILFDIVGV